DVPDAFFNDADNDGINAVLPQADGFQQLVDQTPNIAAGLFDQFQTPAVCSNFSGLTNFSDSFEGPHGQPHIQIGGTMATGHSPGAAIFWLWHAWVDEVYYCYQKDCLGLESDLWMKTDANDSGVEPYPAEYFWVSPDIFSADGWLGNQGALNIQQNNGESVTIVVKVRNRGSLPNENGVGEIKLYWAQASVGLTWPAPFNGTPVGDCPEPVGGFIGSQPLRSVNENYIDEFDADNDGNTTEILEDYTIYYFEWFPPDPDNYVDCFNEEEWHHRHFCILARIEEPGGMTSPEVSYLGTNVRNNNNIVLRNIILWGNGIPDGISPPDPPEECILVGNYTAATMNNVSFKVTFPEASDAEMLNNVELRIRFSPQLHGKWETAGEPGTGVTEEVINGEKWVRFQQENANIQGFTLAPYEIAQGCISIVPIDSSNTEGFYSFDIRQYSGNELIGGERFEVDMKSVVDGRSSSGSLEKQIEQVAEGFLIHPNPAKDYFTISSREFGADNSIEIYNEIGQMVFSAQFAGTSYDTKTDIFG
ncbi:MAG TPA: hypothetical protein ENJ82_04480, partial [Bacteroidetes bacterium]|nr:hypothetical protein [Bacteroidota bacterium]